MQKSTHLAHQENQDWDVLGVSLRTSKSRIQHLEHQHIERCILTGGKVVSCFNWVALRLRRYDWRGNEFGIFLTLELLLKTWFVRLSRTFCSTHIKAPITGLKHCYTHLRFGQYCKIVFSMTFSLVDKHLENHHVHNWCSKCNTCLDVLRVFSCKHP
jgi:hypothetical protein